MRHGSLLALVALFVGCGGSSLVQTALDGDLRSLKRDIAQEQRRGELDRHHSIELARAVAAREVWTAAEPRGIETVRRTAACTSDVADILQKRAARGDDVGAEAEMMLLEARRVDGSSLIRRHAESRNGAFRALAARAAASRASGTLRRRYMLDPDERVRRAAFRAALEARDPGDLEPLLEAGRLDPDAMSRSLATRAAGSIGTQQAVFSLQDFWARADTAERIAIVDAWAMPAALAAGGRERLVRVIETTSGTPALAAADALIRRRGDESGLARSVLLQALKSGSTEERRFAAARVPLEPTTQDALLAASRSDDPAVSVSALRRLLDVPTRRTAAVTSLRALASRDDSTASEARGALASAGDAAARPALQRALTAKQPAARREAALGLIELGDFTSAATALADDDPLVRADVACAMLASD